MLRSHFRTELDHHIFEHNYRRHAFSFVHGSDQLKTEFDKTHRDPDVRCVLSSFSRAFPKHLYQPIDILLKRKFTIASYNIRGLVVFMDCCSA